MGPATPSHEEGLKEGLKEGLEGDFKGFKGGEVAFPFKGALETYTNTCGQEVAAALSFYTTRFAWAMRSAHERYELSIHVNMHESIV